MAGRHHRLSREDLEFIAQDIGSELVTFLSIEERLKGLTPEERLRGLNANELRKLKQIIENSENTQKHEENK